MECGECVERCHFGARRLDEGALAYDPEQCYGCGLCVTTCPAGAVGLELRPAGT
jgi:NAD-dependent dihydropyrimidine dehydrogenase PreA subunit